MDSRGKGGWGLPVIVAVGVFAYYCTTLKFSADPHQRRHDILQRLYDGTSPRTLQQEGYTRAELLDAGVPPAAFSPAASLSEKSASSRVEDVPDSPHRGGLSNWWYDPVHTVTDAVQAASSTLADCLRGRSDSTTAGSPPSGSRNASTRPTTSASPTSAIEAPWDSSSTTTTANAAANVTLNHTASVRVSRAALLHRDAAEELAASTSPERGRSRTPGGAMPIRVAALSTTVPRGYTEESTTARYPLEVRRFLHEDGSRLSVMAESCAAVDGGVFTTEAYVQRSLVRARAAADASKTYFKVKLSIAARNIATTVMESYVNVQVGPSPVILGGFYLVSHSVAYTIQLQTHIGAYEERLADLLYAAQSARLCSAGDGDTASGGRNVFRMQAEGAKNACYSVEVPLELVAQAEAAPSLYRRSLTLVPRNNSISNSDGGPSWTVTVESPPLSAAPPDATTRFLLQDAHVSITLTPHLADHAAGDEADVVKAVTARPSVAAAPAHAYVSSFLTVPLPPPELFRTTVCEHLHDPFVTLFIANAASTEVDVFEVELRCMRDLSTGDLEAFFTYLETLFLTPNRPQRVVNSAGQAGFAIEGLAVAPPETSLRVYGVQVREDCWFVVRWLYADSAVFPRELEHYRRSLVDGVVCVE